MLILLQQLHDLFMGLPPDSNPVNPDYPVVLPQSAHVSTTRLLYSSHELFIMILCLPQEEPHTLITGDHVQLPGNLLVRFLVAKARLGGSTLGFVGFRVRCCHDSVLFSDLLFHCPVMMIRDLINHQHCDLVTTFLQNLHELLVC